ncbi:MAG: hypothetical protein H6760_03245 [Candidatus Nomurabacteria bacterium]|nr:MAG: hypothetical protein H6760_03245 [Candidatus Nomurabacteria bacterium]
MDSEQSDYPSSGFRFNDLPLRLREWFLVHRFQLRKWWVLAILVADTLLFAFVITSVFLYLVQGRGIERGFVERAQALTAPSALSDVAPETLVIDDVTLLSAANDGVDLVTKIENPNTTWVASITSTFSDGVSSTATQTTRLAPGQSSYVYRLAEDWQGSRDSKKVQFQVISLTWQRLSDIQLLENIGFTVSDVSYTATVTVPNSGQTFARVTANIQNDSLYGFWSVRVPVVLLQNSTPIALTTVLLRSFEAGTTKSIDAQWFRSLPSSVTVEVLPEVDIFDQQNYMNL